MTPFQVLDSLLIAPFRLPANPNAGLLLGICALAVASAAIGLGGSALVARSQRTRRDSQESEVAKRSELSYQALREGDKAAYLAQNHLAQQAYGNTLALATGRGAALLWPACGALTWLCWRFDGVPMPHLWRSAGPAVFFLPAFVLALWGLSRLGRKKNAAPSA
ncbi:MAG: hypothetical protein P4L39_05825 [Humidesulfovibrio sp.]|nr:hypothetical protein [Humidesulfovibrio sp.]